MLALGVPMYLFYEVSILIGWVFTRRRRKRSARESAAA
jgi:Sec-independent protein secretion pathway component TatC